MTLRRFESAHTLIETGTYRAKTVTDAIASNLYQRIVSIEIDSQLFSRAQRMFSHISNVELYCGSSPDILNEVIIPDEFTIFYLDAHKTGLGCGIMTNHCDHYGECPLLAEIEIIKNIKWHIPPIIAIHDSQIFCRDSSFWKSPASQHFDESQWPTDVDIQNAMPDYSMELDDDLLIMRHI